MTSEEINKLVGYLDEDVEHEERWKPIGDNVLKDVQERYYASSFGRVLDCVDDLMPTLKSKTLNDTIILKTKHNGSVEFVPLKKIVLQTFCYFPGCEDIPIIFIDKNKDNCTLKNLAYRMDTK